MKKNDSGRMGEKVKLGTTILVQSDDAIDKFKSRYPREYKTPGEVIDLMVDFCLNVNPSAAAELSDFCKQRAEAAGRELDKLEKGSAESLHSAEIRGKRDYFEALASHMERFALSAQGDDAGPAMRRVEMCGGAYAILPDADDWVFVNQAAASRCDNVFVLEVRNGRAFEVPHFVYFKNGETCSNDEMVEAVEPIWPRIREIESAQVVPAYDRNGEFLNYEEWDNSPTIGVFRILDSTDYGRFNEAPCGAMVYRR